LKAIVDYDYAREIIHTYFRKQNLRAVFLPKAIEAMGNGCHVHLSLWKDGKNAIGDKNKPFGISEVAENFIAGIFENYEALLHFLAPTPNSAKRIAPSFSCGAYK